MRVLVCIKRVPAPGARINVTADGQAVDTANLGFTMSPHEECALEAGLQLVEAHGGAVTVLTLGAPEAEEQLRYAASLGVGTVVLLPTDGTDWDPQRTARALTTAIGDLEAADGPFDLIVVGNEAADSGGFQVGIRVAVGALGRPMVTGAKGLTVTDATARVQREIDGVQEVYELPLPALVGVKEGINLPRYPTMKGRLASRKAVIDARDAVGAPGGPALVRLQAPPEQASHLVVLGEGPAAAGAVVDVLAGARARVNVILAFVEHDRGAVVPATYEAMTFGRTLADSLGAELHAATVGAAADESASDLGVHGATVVHQAHHDLLTDYGADVSADVLAALVGTLEPAAVVACGTDRGNEVLAQLAARLDAPFVANALPTDVDASTDAPWELTRVRWGGSLLERTTVTAPVKLLTVALHTVDATPADVPSAAERRPYTPAIDPTAGITIVRDRVEREAGVTLATATVVVGGGRGVGSAEGFAPLEELAAALGGVVGCSRAVTNNGWRNHTDQVGQTGTRIGADVYFACGISGAIQHWVGASGAQCIIAINTDPAANMVVKADYAVIGDLHEVVPAITAELARRR